MSKHPVDALKELGLPMSAACEAEMRRVCDEEVPVEQAAALVSDYEAVQRFTELLKASEPVDWGAPRVITRVMDDGIETKDGAA